MDENQKEAIRLELAENEKKASLLRGPPIPQLGNARTIKELIEILSNLNPDFTWCISEETCTLDIYNKFNIIGEISCHED